MCYPQVQAPTRHVPQNREEASLLAFRAWEVSNVCRSTETLSLANHHQCVSSATLHECNNFCSECFALMCFHTVELAVEESEDEETSVTVRFLSSLFVLMCVR